MTGSNKHAPYGSVNKGAVAACLSMALVLLSLGALAGGPPVSTRGPGGRNVIPAPATTPTTTPAMTTESSDPVVILPIPSAADQDAANKRVNELLQKELTAKTPKELRALYEKLMALAAESKDNPADRYVLLRDALDVAVRLGDSNSAMTTVDSLAAFAVDRTDASLRALMKIGEAVATPAVQSQIVDHLTAMLDAAEAGDDYDNGSKIADALTSMSPRIRDLAVVKANVSRVEEFTAAKQQYAAVVLAKKTLASKPLDPEASAVVGSYYCFYKSDWDAGLPRLSIGNDEALRKLADQDAAGIKGDATAQAASADAWFDYAAKATAGKMKTGAQQRAAYWYEKAIPGLTGLAKPLAQKRLDSLPRVATRNRIDLLKLVDVKRDAVSGVWRVQDGSLESDQQLLSRLEFPYEPPEEYDFRIVFTLDVGGNGPAQMCTANGRQFLWGVGAVGAVGEKFAGFENISGKRLWENKTAAVSSLENHKQYESLVQVRKSGVKGYINGKLLTEWKTDYSDASMPKDWMLRHDRVVGIGTHGTRVIFHAVEVTEITGKGKLARGLTMPENLLAATVPGKTLADAIENGAASQPAQTQPHLTSPCALVVKSSGLCLDSSPVRGMVPTLAQFTSKPSQIWKLEADADGAVRFINSAGGLFLAVREASTTPGADVIQWPKIVGKDNEQSWKVEVIKGEFVRITNAHSQLCLTAEGRITQRVWTGADNQLWRLAPPPPPPTVP